SVHLVAHISATTKTRRSTKTHEENPFVQTISSSCFFAFFVVFVVALMFERSTWEPPRKHEDPRGRTKKTRLYKQFLLRVSSCSSCFRGCSNVRDQHGRDAG